MEDEADDKTHHDFIFILKKDEELDVVGLVMTMRFDGARYNL